VSTRNTEVHQGQSCFNTGQTAVYTKRRKVVVICLNTTSTEISVAFVLHERAAHKTDGIEHCSPFQVSDLFLVIYPFTWLMYVFWLPSFSSVF